jgi:TPR repeat protein
LADNLNANHLVAQAVVWYRKAAEQGSVEAKFRLGDILIRGSSAPADPSQRVAPNPVEGVRWTYEAATNFHVGACQNMAYALENGLGIGANLVEAYAWLDLSAARSNAVNARVDMNRLALRMDLKQLRESHAMADQFRNRQWPPRSAQHSSTARELRRTWLWSVSKVKASRWNSI